jgi:hypothetical protein
VAPRGSRPSTSRCDHQTPSEHLQTSPRRHRSRSIPQAWHHVDQGLPRLVATIKPLPNTFKPHHDDIVLAAYPKCGTTWIKALAFAITNRSRYDFANHPLLTRHPQEVVPYIEIPLHGDTAYIETLPSPRLLATHSPLSCLFPNSSSGSSSSS